MTPTKAPHRWTFIALLLLTAGSYSNSLNVPFLFDDRTSILENFRLRQLWPGLGLFGTSPDMTPYGRPLVEFSLALNWALSGEATWSYHLCNLGLHLFCALVIWRLASGLFARLPSINPEWREWCALAVAGLWMTHPLQTAAVTYVVQRAEVMMSLCYALTLLCALKAANAHRSPRRAGWLSVAAITACMLGALCKESIVTAPLAVMLMDAVVLRSDLRGRWRRRVALYAGLAASWILLAILMMRFPRARSVGFYDMGPDALQYLLMQSEIVLHYLRLVFLPFGLSIDHDWRVPTGMADVWPALTATIALLGIALWLCLRRNGYGFLGLMVFLILAPTSSIVPIITSVAAEHRMYCPSAFVVMIVVGAVATAVSWCRINPRTAVVALVSIILLFAALTYQRNTVFNTASELWAEVVMRYPQSRRAWNNLGTSLMLEGRDGDALTAFQRALKLKAEFGPALANVGTILAKQGRVAEAEPYLARAVRAIGENPAVLFKHAAVLHALGRTEEALERLEAGLRLSPGHPEAIALRDAVLDERKRMQAAQPSRKEKGDEQK